ncbi:dTDP-4-dehydrorhamnose 3,5-epimerase family protein [Streptomyces sp. NA04227]|uniref:dTDP-4-dehydrorhamnose 3,5-epimerase family protein n=1 Tax=Streptomyces sp. NA04227 TaxID=2742136 RepID=UPI001590DEE6|nr:dTDP-4-dehydrorhamnose 3,5-epimerase [Streptomyces sp. NA04227]QKW08010.1 dTDP-4-dehydrorhamnose 3,5-epimerase family protein [Streptomyces sp. NA04227]
MSTLSPSPQGSSRGLAEDEPRRYGDTLVRELAVAGALEFTPAVYPDERGAFVSPFQEPAFLQAHGGPLFEVAQLSHSRSRRGVVRGVHYTLTDDRAPANAKYVHCPYGEVLDLVVDLREGSPTFGAWDAVVLDADHCRAVYLPPGVGHAFVSLRDDSVMSYLLAASYAPAQERALSALDPALGLPIPADIEPLLSARDLAAPTLAEARAAGQLPVHRPTRPDPHHPATGGRVPNHPAAQES